MNYTIENGIGIFEDAISLNMCQTLIDFLEYGIENNMAFDRKTYEKFPAHKKNDQTMLINQFEMARREFPFDINEVLQSVHDCYSLYTDKYSIIHESKSQILSPIVRVQKTGIGGGYHTWHCETDGLSVSHRVAAWTIYLNNVQVGGETEFLYYPLRVAPKVGTLCIFPSGFMHAHRGNPPISGDKYILTSWIEMNE